MSVINLSTPNVGGQIRQGVTELVIKSFDTSQTLKIVSLSKKCQVFPKPFYFSFIFLDNTLHTF